jgi:hypothetical protein
VSVGGDGAVGTTEGDPHGDDLRRPPLSVWAWVAVALGWALMVWAVIGMVGDQSGAQLRSWAVWLVGVAIVNDVVLVPLAVAVGMGLSRLTPSWRRPLRWALVTIGTVALATWPVVARYGADPRNDSVLPLPGARNLSFVALGIVVVAFGAVWFLRRADGASERTTIDAGGSPDRTGPTVNDVRTEETRG